jgi:hypothetical protein
VHDWLPERAVGGCTPRLHGVPGVSSAALTKWLLTSRRDGGEGVCRFPRKLYTHKPLVTRVLTRADLVGGPAV